MSVQLEIRDGNPWWLSTDIWTVPGDDPEGPPGIPIAGTPAYLWAKVRNAGDTGVNNATVRFYWANPNVGFDRTSANAIGAAFVSLDPGQTQDVLCLTPWIPAFVNNGHECVLAETFHASDPLPAAPDFNVVTDRHVAQRNLNVLMTSMQRFSGQFEIHNPRRRARTFQLRIEQAPLSQIEALVPYYGALLRQLKPGKVANLHFTQGRHPCEELPHKKDAQGRSPVELSGGSRTGLTLAGEIESGAALIHIRQFDEHREVGGLSVLVIQR